MALIVFVFQISLSIFILEIQTFQKVEAYREKPDPVFELQVGYARFVLAFMMHIQMLPEL